MIATTLPATGAADTLPLASSPTPTQRRKRRFLGRPKPIEQPRQSIESREGVRVVRVQLSGRHGTGRSFIVEPDDWRLAVDKVGTRWTAISHKPKTPGKPPRMLVVSGKAVATQHARQHCPRQSVVLARLIMGVTQSYLRVRYNNWDVFDLRRCNLRIEDTRKIKLEKAVEVLEAA